MKFLNIPIIQAAAIMALLACSAAAAKNSDLTDKAAVDTAIVSTAEKQPYGIYLVDAAGYSLYLFKADVKGKKSTCYGKCAKVWPPLLTNSLPYVGGRARKALVDVIVRKNGDLQVTYNGWPVYYYIKDDEPGNTTGHDVMSFGADWYLVTSQSGSDDANEHSKGHSKDQSESDPQ